jgi:hypothetical protein
MQKHIIDEITGIPYTLVCDYYLPFGDMPDEEEQQHHIGIWGQRHLRYIRKNKKSLYTSLLTSGKLNGHLADIDKQADEMFTQLVKEMAVKQGITEQLKAEDQMAWVGAMNNIRHSATEIVNYDLIYG